jgi:hypothetical protein
LTAASPLEGCAAPAARREQKEEGQAERCDEEQHDMSTLESEKPEWMFDSKKTCLLGSGLVTSVGTSMPITNFDLIERIYWTRSGSFGKLLIVIQNGISNMKRWMHHFHTYT